MTKIQVNSSGKAYTTGNNKVLAAIAGTPEWGDITGTLSDQTDLQTALNAKVTGNTAITGATKCKITYDSKGLVTAGADLSASDIPDISATYQTKLTSGTNIKTINSTSLLGSGDISITGLPSQTSQSGKFLTTNGTTASWATVDALPSQTSQSGKFLTTNGTTASWADIPTEIPSQSGQSGKFLTTNGTTASWADIPTEIPSQSGQSGKFLTTNGTAASWSSLPTVDQTYNASSTNAQSGVAVAGALSTVLPSQTSQSGKFLTTNGSAVSWANIPEELPSQTGNSGKYLTTNGTTASWATVLSTITYTPTTETLEFT